MSNDTMTKLPNEIPKPKSQGGAELAGLDWRLGFLVLKRRERRAPWERLIQVKRVRGWESGVTDRPAGWRRVTDRAAPLGLGSHAWRVLYTCRSAGASE
ncbi:MAG: hypothetical protein JWR69_265, partial [Pedosphaera sp.]|nr:hypothetical protein [Pedosphaera sp.]